jgi:perosamine synthetase
MSWDLINKSDLVIGMSSMFLIEAVMMGKPTISVMIGLEGKNPFILSRRKILNTVLTEKELTHVIKLGVFGKLNQKINFPIISSSCERIWKMLEKIYMPKLAINGGRKIRIKKFPPYNFIGKEEKKAVMRVLNSGILSRFLGAKHADFYGGDEIKSFEKKWAKFYGVKHAISVNSATSGLYVAVGATGVAPGDEIIVSPYTMSASAVAPLIWNAIPVFADIEEDYFCLSPKSIEKQITNKTKAMIIVDIFGQPYDVEKINYIAKKHNLIVIEDAAQAPAAKYKKKYAGTLGNIGVYSLNYHKHIHTGEGGVIVTNDDELAEKMRLIRNHAEAVAEDKGTESLVNMIGYNFRMTEIEAAIGKEQLNKLEKLNEARIKNVEYLSKKLAAIPCLEPAKIRPGCKHVFYVHPIKFNEELAGVHRNKFVEAVKAELPVIKKRETEGVKIGTGYVKPLYLEPLYQNKIAYGKFGFPWKIGNEKSNVSYKKGICPVAEKMHENVLVIHEMFAPGMTKKDLDDVVSAFQKVWDNIDQLK